MLIRSIFIILFIILFIITILFILYKFFHKKIDTEFQKRIHLNSWIINKYNNKKCPNGCKNKKCEHGSKCYNCNSENPICCCYDSQCENC